MKKAISIIICLMAVVLNANAQIYSRHGGRIGNRMASYAHSVKMNAISNHSTWNYTYGEAKNYNSDNDDFWLKHFVHFGFGIGGGNISLNSHSNGTFDLDLIVMNILFSAKFANVLTIDVNKIDSKDANSYQLGILIPIYTFDSSECIGGEKGKIFIAPLIEFVSAQDVHYSGHFMHEHTLYHNCQNWISTTTKEDINSTGYGGAVMIKYGCGYLLGKVTNKSWGASIGFCL